MNFRKLFAQAVEKWPAKVISLALAIFLFVFHRMVTLETRFFYVPLVIESLNSLMPSSPYPRLIMVNLRGEASGINSILEDDIEVFVDMYYIVTPGIYVVPVQWRKRGTAEGVDPLQVSVDPAEITFSLDHRIIKSVPITPNFRGQVDAGFDMTLYDLNPDRVIIEGPAGRIAGVMDLPTEPIDLQGQRSDFSMTVAIQQRDPLLLVRGSGLTEFRGSITQIVPVRNITNVPITITGIREGLTAELEINAGSLHLEGDNRDAVEAFQPAPGFLWVDGSGISEPGIYILNVLTEPAENLIVRVEPREVTIHISSAEE